MSQPVSADDVILTAKVVSVPPSPKEALSPKPAEVADEEEESEVEISAEDESRLTQLKNSIRKAVQASLLNQPLNVLLNKSDDGHSWKKANVHAIVSSALSTLKTAFSWLSFDENIPVNVNEHGENAPGAGTVEICCKVNATVFFCFNIRFAPLSRVSNAISVINESAVIELKNHSSEAYEQTKSVDELLTNMATDFRKDEKVFVLSNVPVTNKPNAFTVSCESLMTVKEKAEFRLQNSVEEMHENGFSFHNKHIEKESVRIFFGVLYVMGHHVKFSDEISFYG